jgi:type I restriction enzyme M protein
VLFVDYIAEHLNPKGRAGIIVPEGIIFQSGTAYKSLRKMLVENHLYAVVSLPAGVFNPYSGVKTSILLMDRALAKTRDEILFVKIDNDGYSLGAQRNSVKGGQLEEAIEIIKNFREGTFKESSLAHAVPKAEIAKNGDFNLSGERHKSKRPSLSNFELVKLSDERFFQILAGGTPSSENKEYWNGTINWATLVDLPANDFISNIYSTARKITEDGLKNSSAKLLPANSVIVSTRATIGRIAINRVECSTNQGFKNIVIKKFNKTNTVFVALMMTRLVDKMNQMATGVTFKELSATAFKTLQIPLPPLSVQEEIVAEIEGYQKIIDGAKMVVENYKPRIDIDPEWEMVELGEVITLQRGYDLPKQNWKKGEYPIVGSNGIIGFHENYKEKGPGVVTGRSGTIGKVHYIDYEYYWPHNTSLFVKDFKNNYPKFIKYLLETLDLKSLGERTSAVPSLDRKNAHKLKVFLPPIETQRQIVSQIEQEQQLVNANKQLIDLFEKKIKDRIAKVWGE